MEKADLNPLFQKLSNEIKAESDDQVVKIADQLLSKVPDDNDIKLCKAIGLIRLSKFDQALTVMGKQVTPQESNQAFAYLYTLYKLNRYDECLTFIRDCAKAGLTSISHQLIEAQIYYKQQKFEDAVKVYLEISQKYPDNDEYNEILVNILNCFYSANVAVPENFRRVCDDALKKKDIIREFFFNLSLSYSNIGDVNTANSILQRFEASLGDDGGDDQDTLNDRIMCYLQQDANDSTAFEFSEEQINDKIKSYEENTQSNLDESLRLVLLSNLACLYYKRDSSVPAETIKRIDEEVQNNPKKTPYQVLLAKYNKVIYLLEKNKFNDAQKVLQELENNNLVHKYALYEQVIISKAFVLYKLKSFGELENLLGSLLKSGQSRISRLTFILLRAEIYRLQNNTARTIQNLKAILSENKDLLENEVFANFFVNLITSNPEILQEFKGSIVDAAKTTTSVGLLTIIGELLSKDKNYKGAMEIYQRAMQITPDDKRLWSKYVVCLAKIDPVKAEGNLSKLPIVDLITDTSELRRLEMDVTSLSKKAEKEKKEAKLDDASKKIKKKKKKLILYPKGFDPKNPGPAPDPERWLPKYQRSKFKKFAKKKGLLRGAQGAATGKETMSTFQTGPSTATQDIARDKGTGHKKKKRQYVYQYMEECISLKVPLLQFHSSIKPR
eukprot:TRINITY_DN11935_c0_g1_i6.p1 TRINITY_DN11935_c0_g1~~TRINITY_DN11935_c0_g1_i6.p1  ORF type:complete len:670 (-),score=178.01 TRINITY_DN11935_c0_g1_i6:133-2142(-)